MRKRIMSTLLGLSLATALVAAGCGGGDDNDTSVSSLSKSEWIAKADAICHADNKDLNRVTATAFANKQPTQNEQLRFVTQTIVPKIQQQIDQVRALGAPQGDQQAVNAFLAEAQRALDQGKANPSLLTDNPSGKNPFAQTRVLAEGIGLQICGR
jgi:hypothetical protein